MGWIQWVSSKLIGLKHLIYQQNQIWFNLTARFFGVTKMVFNTRVLSTLGLNDLRDFSISAASRGLWWRFPQSDVQPPQIHLFTSNGSISFVSSRRRRTSKGRDLFLWLQQTRGKNIKKKTKGKHLQRQDRKILTVLACLVERFAPTHRNVEHLQPVADSSRVQEALKLLLSPRRGRLLCASAWQSVHLRAGSLNTRVFVCLIAVFFFLNAATVTVADPLCGLFILPSCHIDFPSPFFFLPLLSCTTSASGCCSRTVPASATFRPAQQAASWKLWFFWFFFFFFSRHINKFISSGIQRDSDSVCHLEADFTVDADSLASFCSSVESLNGGRLWVSPSLPLISVMWRGRLTCRPPVCILQPQKSHKLLNLARLSSAPNPNRLSLASFIS